MFFGHANVKMIDPMRTHLLPPTARAGCLREFIHTPIYSGLVESVF